MNKALHYNEYLHIFYLILAKENAPILASSQGGHLRDKAIYYITHTKTETTGACSLPPVLAASQITFYTWPCRKENKDVQTSQEWKAES